MNLIDKINYIKKRLTEKRNIILIIILTILLIVIFSCLTLTNLVINVRNDTYHTLKYRTFILYGATDEIDKIKEIEHIKLITSNKFYLGLYHSVKEFDNELSKGELVIKPLLVEDGIKIVKGEKIKNSGESICPNNLYPHDIYTNDSSKKVIYKELYLKGKDILGKEFTLYSSNTDYLNQAFNFKITGTYQNNQLEEPNICYIPVNDFDKLKENYSTTSISVDIYGNKTITPNYYKDLMIIIDSYENINEVINTLTDMGYGYDQAITFDEVYQKLMIYVPLFIAIIIMIISINIIYSFLRKKTNYNRNTYGILKSIGYNNKTIYKLELLENIIIFFISFIIAFIIYIIGCQIVTNTILIEMLYQNYMLKIPWHYLLVLIIIFILLIKLIEMHLLKKHLKSSIKTLLEK